MQDGFERRSLQSLAGPLHGAFHCVLHDCFGDVLISWRCHNFAVGANSPCLLVNLIMANDVLIDDYAIASWISMKVLKQLHAWKCWLRLSRCEPDLSI